MTKTLLDTKTLVDYAALVHTNSVNKGFYNGYVMHEFPHQATKIALIHSEATEVLEALRKEKGEHEVVKEICDILIRTFDFYAALVDAGVVTEDLDDVMEEVMTDNTKRPHMHGVLG